MQWLYKVLVTFFLEKLWGSITRAYYKHQKEKLIEENQKKLNEAIKSGDLDAIKKASENALNGTKNE